MNFDLGTITGNIVSQIAVIVLLIMAIRALIAYTREDWGAFWSGLTMGMLALVVVYFGAQIEDLAKWLGDNIFS